MRKLINKKRVQPPIYKDGVFSLYKIVESNDIYPEMTLEDEKLKMSFTELSVSDCLKSELEKRGVILKQKVRVPYTPNVDITSMHVLKINNNFYKVYNTYNFYNKEGFKEIDISLVDWGDRSE